MLHLVKYRFLQIIRMRALMFWALLFPVILGTLYYFGFWKNANCPQLEMIDVAVVAEEDSPFLTFLEGAEDLLSFHVMEEEEAEKALENGKVQGIYTEGRERTLTVAATGVAPSILETILEQYNTNERLIEKVAVEHPERLEGMMDSMKAYRDRTTETSLGGTVRNSLVEYFFALVGMACMFGCDLGFAVSLSSNADQSPVGMRRNISYLSRGKIMMADFLVVYGIHFVNLWILICYLKGILRIPLGEDNGKILLLCMAVGMIGVSFGIIAGSIGKSSGTHRLNFLTLITMLLSFFGGLMVQNMRHIVDKCCPLLNAWNPVALISDGFFSMTIYEDMARYWRNVIMLFGMGMMFLVAGCIVMRRKRYDSI